MMAILTRVPAMMTNMNLVMLLVLVLKIIGDQRQLKVNILVLQLFQLKGIVIYHRIHAFPQNK